MGKNCYFYYVNGKQLNKELIQWRKELKNLNRKTFWYALIISPWNPGSNMGMKRKKPPTVQAVRDVKEGRLTWPLGGIMTGNDFKFFPIF